MKTFQKLLTINHILLVLLLSKILFGSNIKLYWFELMH